MHKTVAYYAAVFAGIALLVAAVFVAPTRPFTLLLFVPLLTLWSIWLVITYWKWVRSL
jgi:hypothetical protein